MSSLLDEASGICISSYSVNFQRRKADAEDVVGGASPMSTAVTGSISWYSMPPSETNVEMPSSMCEDKTRSVGDRIKDKGDESALKCRDYLENLVLNESATSSALNEAFLEIEETNNNKTAEGRDPYDFDTAIEA